MTVEQMIKNGATPEEVLKEVTRLMNENDSKKEKQAKIDAAHKNVMIAMGKYFATLGHDEDTIKELLKIFDEGLKLIADTVLNDKKISFKLPSNLYKYFL